MSEAKRCVWVWLEAARDGDIRRDSLAMVAHAAALGCRVVGVVVVSQEDVFDNVQETPAIRALARRISRFGAEALVAIHGHNETIANAAHASDSLIGAMNHAIKKNLESLPRISPP